MIQNFTKAEWDVLLDAINEKEQDLEQNPENYSYGARGSSAGQKRAALDRALEKARQLAPEA